MEASQLGALLLETRKEKGISLRKAASEAGVSLNSYYSAERGGSVRSITLLKLVDWLNIPVGDLSPTPGVRHVAMNADDARSIWWAVGLLGRLQQLVGQSDEFDVHAERLSMVRSRYVEAPRVHTKK